MQRDLSDARPVPGWLQGQASAPVTPPITFAGERRALFGLQSDLARRLADVAEVTTARIGLDANTNVGLALFQVLVAENCVARLDAVLGGLRTEART